MCEKLPLFTEMKYLASKQNWNLQTLKVPDTNSWVVPSTRFKFRNRDLRCTIPRTPIHKQYSDPWEIERFVFKLEVSWKPLSDSCLGHARRNPYMAQVHPTHCKKLFCQSDRGDRPLPKSRNSHCSESLEHGDNSPSSTSLQQSVLFVAKSDWERETGSLPHVWKAFQVVFVQFRFFPVHPCS